MKYALSRTCKSQFLKAADEIIVQYKDKDWLYDYNELYGDKVILLTCVQAKEPGDIDWAWVKNMRQLYKDIYVGVPNFGFLAEAQVNECPAYLIKYINNFSDLNLCYRFDAVYVYLDQPLFSNIKTVKNFKIPARYTPNIAFTQQYNPFNPLHGIWIRPEDIDAYDYGDCACEFITDREVAEERFFQVYKIDKAWPMDISLLIQDLKNTPATNRLIDSELSVHRMNCRQRCEEAPGSIGCHLCDLEFATSQREKLVEYVETMNKKNESINTDT